MSDEFESGLRAWLAHRERVAAAVTSPDRVIARVESALAGGDARVRRGGPSVRWVAPGAAMLAVAVLLVAVIAGSLGLRSSHSNPAPARPQLPGRPWIDGPVPTTPPPAGVSLAWVRDPRDQDRTIAFDWSGRPVGSLPLPKDNSGFGFPTSYSTSPDGQRLVITAPDGTTLWLETAQGRRLATLPPAQGATSHMRNHYPTTFAGNDDTLCQERYDVGQPGWVAAPRTLYVLRSDGSVLHSLAEAPPDASADLFWSLASCDAATDTAVFVAEHRDPPQTQTFSATTSTSHSGSLGIVSIGGGGVSVRHGPQWVAMVRVVRLSNGVETYRHVYADDTVRAVAAPPGGGWIVEDPIHASTDRVRDLRTGRVVSLALGGYAMPLDATRIELEDAGSDAHGHYDDITVVDWRRSAVLFHTVLPDYGMYTRLSPDGTVLLVQYGTLFMSCGGTVDDWVMVGQNGTTIPLTRGTCRHA